MRRLSRFSVLRLLSLLLVYGVFLGAGAAYHVWRELAKDLPAHLDTVLDYAPARATRVYSVDGELIGEFFLTKRIVVPLDRIPDHVEQAFISAEDRRFRKHKGFDPIGIARAAYENYVAGGVRQGASTITQQVARMLMLSNEKTLSRKLKEIILSVRVERELSKEQILHIYLNHVYLGHGAYGVQAAAENYFGKDVEHLTLAEAALLAGLPKAPTKFSPYNDYVRARERQAYVLSRMVEDGAVTREQAAAARAEPLALVSREQPLNKVAAPYFVEHIRRWATEKYGERSVFDGGLRIYTTLDMKKQRAAEAAVKDGLEALDRKLGFRGPLGTLQGPDRDAFAEGPPRPLGQDPRQPIPYVGGELLEDVTYVGMVASISEGRKGIQIDLGPVTLRLDDADQRRLLRWRERDKGRRETRRLQVGDLVPVRVVRDREPPRRGKPAKGDHVVLAQTPDVQGALVALDPQSGDVVAMVGGYDWAQSQFNRATQARRQAGSSIKPFVYAAALLHGYTPTSIVVDAPVAIRTATGIWAPSNYKREYLGAMTLKTALAKSINTVSVRLVAGMGIEPMIKIMRGLGVTSPIPRHISIALGTPDVTLLEMTAAYAGFPAGGRRVTPRFVTRVETDRGQLVEDLRRVPEGEQVLPPAVAYVMTNLLKGVIERGTGTKAKELGRPAAGKTGTSTGFRDAWFIAFTRDLVCGVWVGRDNFKPIGYNATGGATALPIWLQFMQAAHPDTPVRDFDAPPDVTFVRANELTGQPAAPGAPNASWIPFVRGTVPPQFTSSVDASRFSTAGGFQ